MDVEEGLSASRKVAVNALAERFDAVPTLIEILPSSQDLFPRIHESVLQS